MAFPSQALNRNLRESASQDASIELSPPTMLRYASQANWQGYWPGRMKAQDRGPYSEKEAEIARLKRLHRRLGGETIDVKGYRFRKAADREGAADPTELRIVISGVGFDVRNQCGKDVTVYIIEQVEQRERDQRVIGIHLRRGNGFVVLLHELVRVSGLNSARILKRSECDWNCGLTTKTTKITKKEEDFLFLSFRGLRGLRGLRG